MGTMRLVGNDTITINDRLIVDLPHGEVGKVSFPNDLVTVKTGKNGNAIYASNASGSQATFELKVLRGSADDAYLNEQIATYQNDPTKFNLMNATLVKMIGDGAGEVTSDTYILTGGVFTKMVEGVSNVEGDVEQAVSQYTMQFAMAPRAIV